MKIKDDLKRLRRLVPKTDRKTGQLYGNASQRAASYKKITLYTLFISDEKELLLRPHLIWKKEPKSPQEWRQWLDRNIDNIMRESILGGLSRITGELSKQWAVLSYIGWVGDAEYKPRNPGTRRKRNPARKKGRARG